MVLPYDWKEKLRPANLRDTMNQNSMVIGIGAAVVVVLAIAWMVHTLNPSNAVAVNDKAYYVDLSTPSPHKIFVRGSGLFPPLKGATGKPSIVEAIFFSNDNCKHKQLGYYMMYSPAAKAAMDKLRQAKNPSSPEVLGPSMAEMEGGRLVRKPGKNQNWYRADSPQGFAVTQVPAQAGSKPWQVCLPH